MTALAERRQQRSTNIWPGFVDALATLLMVLVFLLMLFVVAQFFLGEAISGRDEALRNFQKQINELAELLSLERKANTELSLNAQQLSEELQASVAARDSLSASIQTLTRRAETAEERAESLNRTLAEAFDTITADKQMLETQAQRIAALVLQVEAQSREIATQSERLEAQSREIESQAEKLAEQTQTIDSQTQTIRVQKDAIEVKVNELAALVNDVAALRALKAELEAEIKKKDSSVTQEREISATARAQVALLNRQTAALREQLQQLANLLEAAERKAKDQNVQIASLGQRLNAALATRVQELSRYRSEFFGRLREILGNRPGIQIVGDRFVFQSEVLFASGSAELGEEGMIQLGHLATALIDIARTIPPDIDWMLRVDGHTDQVPINTARFPSNWELSAARAISVVKFLIDQGLPSNRLAAAGFGEFKPLDEIALHRNRRIEFKLTER